jgi:cytochrome o ubiquinol oxidase operon protein cyoD
MSKENFLKSYIAGFLLSIIYTIAAYVAVVRHMLLGGNLTFFIIGLGILQAAVQLTFFLHLNMEKRPRLNLAIFISTLGVILIVVIGSIWIMSNLNYRHSSDAEIFQQEGISK